MLFRPRKCSPPTTTTQRALGDSQSSRVAEVHVARLTLVHQQGTQPCGSIDQVQDGVVNQGRVVAGHGEAPGGRGHGGALVGYPHSLLPLSVCLPHPALPALGPVQPCTVQDVARVAVVGGHTPVLVVPAVLGHLNVPVARRGGVRAPHSWNGIVSKESA